MHAFILQLFTNFFLSARNFQSCSLHRQINCFCWSFWNICKGIFCWTGLIILIKVHIYFIVPILAVFLLGSKFGTVFHEEIKFNFFWPDKFWTCQIIFKLHFQMRKYLRSLQFLFTIVIIMIYWSVYHLFWKPFSTLSAKLGLDVLPQIKSLHMILKNSPVQNPSQPTCHPHTLLPIRLPTPGPDPSLPPPPIVFPLQGRLSQSSTLQTVYNSHLNLPRLTKSATQLIPRRLHKSSLGLLSIP